VGDAGGLVDPITGEGLYYAMRSGDLASRVVINDAHCPQTKAHAYRAELAREFALDLEFAAVLAKRVFLGSFLFKSVPEKMIYYTRKSARFRALMQDLFAGTQPYCDLKSRLLRNVNGAVHEVIMNFFLDRIIPENSRAAL
jgi:flavin-dependent dehydrogenase